MAERQLAAALEQPAVRQVWTMRRWLGYWLSVIEQRMRPSATRAHRSVVRRHLIPLLGSLRLDEVDARTVQRVIDQIGAQRVTRSGRLIQVVVRMN